MRTHRTGKTVSSQDASAPSSPTGARQSQARVDAERSAFARRMIRKIVASFDSLVTRLYSRIRFTILRQPFLDEIGQYLPKDGRILDLGCGFGLFSLYFAALEKERDLIGIDLNARRIEQATLSAKKLDLTNVRYEAMDVLDWSSDDTFDAIYFLDLVHHLPAEFVPVFLQKVRKLIRPGGILIIKDVADKPYYKMLFTLILDRLMVGMEPIRYWPPSELQSLVESLGFEVVRHKMIDILPYPHILYVARLSDHE